jgi:hypothetical protein
LVQQAFAIHVIPLSQRLAVMGTVRQQLGERGELIVVKKCSCPRCKRPRTLKRLPTNFKCADVICDFCGYLAQVKAATVRNVEVIPNHLLGGAWSVQKARKSATGNFRRTLTFAIRLQATALSLPTISCERRYQKNYLMQ